MIALLCQANALVGEAQVLKALPTGDVKRLRTRYDTILTEAEAGNPPRSCRPAVLAPAGASNNPRPATSFGDCVSTATRSCASSPTCAFPSTTTRPNATCECPNSSRKSPVVSAPKPAEILCHHPLLPFDPPQTVRRSFQLARPDVPRATPNAPIGV